MVTLKDVAALAGVSIATVSYVVNGTKPVKQETRFKILNAIDQLNYIPNSSARNLKNQATNEIGVVFPSIDDYCHSEILKGIVSSLGDRNYNLSIAFSYGMEKMEQQIIDNFISKNVSGLILMTCQPDNTLYFQQSIVKYDTPVVFLERFPKNIDANFLAFDNYNTVHFLTGNLVKAGYTSISIVTGNPSFFSEGECIRGYMDALDDLMIPPHLQSVISVKMTKEHSFRTAADLLANHRPQAVITTSDIIAKGLMEACSLFDLKLDQDITLITLGEDCWNKSNYSPNLLHTSRTAYTLGEAAAETLLRNIESDEFEDKEFMLFHDNIIDTTLKLPAPSRLNLPLCRPAQKNLRIIATSLPTIRAAQIIASEFEAQHQVKLTFEYKNYHDLIQTILSDSKKEKPEFDIYMHDISWLPYLVQENALMDISDFISSTPFITRRLITKNLENCCFHDRCYGVPIVGGTHLLFYRKDLFENTAIQKQYKAKHQISLRPPKTWKEFNEIARFFTKEYNPDSPTLYGTSIPGELSEALALDYIIRMWSFGGGLARSDHRLTLNTFPNEKATASLIESFRYTDGNVFDRSIEECFAQFGSGKSAMVISYTEYAAQIQNYIHSDIITKIGYAMIPGSRPANVGWNLGVSPHTENFELIKEFFHWLCLRHTSYYMTILSGQSAVTYPYKNHEILKLYPWLKATQEGLERSTSRNYPFRGKTRNIAPIEVTNLLSDMLRDIADGKTSPADGLNAVQTELLKLFNS